MSIMFTQAWVESVANKWNADPEMVLPLREAHFEAIVALGLTTQEDPSVLLEIKGGKVLHAGEFNPARGAKSDWDLRAAADQWQMWQKEGLQLASLGVAVATRKLQFKAGDYRKMIRTPSLASPFLRFFRHL